MRGTRPKPSKTDEKQLKKKKKELADYGSL